METLIKEIQNGQIDKYEIVISELQNQIYKYILRMVNNQHSAEELTQVVFVTGYYNLKKYRFNISFKAWIYKIAKNTTLNYLKKRRRENHYIESMKDDHTYHMDYFKEGYNVRIEKTFEQMKANDKNLIIMKGVEEFSYKEMSEIYNKSEATIRKRYERAKKKFQEIYNSYEEESIDGKCEFENILSK